MTHRLAASHEWCLGGDGGGGGAARITRSTPCAACAATANAEREEGERAGAGVRALAGAGRPATALPSGLA